MLRHERIKVKRDNNTVHNLTVAPWEIPIIEFLFDEGNVEKTGEFVALNDRDYPDPGQEFVRLQKAYGADVKTNVPHAVTIYGAQRAGVRAVAKAIDAAREDDEEAAKRKGKKRPSRVVDPLLN